jgi:hypothetical protein
MLPEEPPWNLLFNGFKARRALYMHFKEVYPMNMEI